MVENIAQNNVYLQLGFANREAYLQSLSKSWGINIELVRLMSCLLPEEEDFDGLIALLTDYVFIGRIL